MLAKLILNAPTLFLASFDDKPLCPNAMIAINAIEKVTVSCTVTKGTL
jgi:hypothetical protein